MVTLVHVYNRWKNSEISCYVNGELASFGDIAWFVNTSDVSSSAFVSTVGESVLVDMNKLMKRMTLSVITPQNASCLLSLLHGRSLDLVRLERKMSAFTLSLCSSHTSLYELGPQGRFFTRCDTRFFYVRVKENFPRVVLIPTVHVRRHASECKLATQLRFGLLWRRHVFTCLLNYCQEDGTLLLALCRYFPFLVLPVPDVWQVFPGIVRDGGHQPRVLRTDGGSLPVRRGSQRCSDPGHLPPGTRLPGWKASSQQCLCNSWIHVNEKPCVFLWPVLCISGHVQVQGWERPAFCRASQDLTLRWQTVLEHCLHIQPSCYRRPALPWVLPKGQRLHFCPLASCTHAAGNCLVDFKSRTSWHLVAVPKTFTPSLSFMS